MVKCKGGCGRRLSPGTKAVVRGTGAVASEPIQDPDGARACGMTPKLTGGESESRPTHKTWREKGKKRRRKKKKLQDTAAEYEAAR